MQLNADNLPPCSNSHLEPSKSPKFSMLQKIPNGESACDVAIHLFCQFSWVLLFCDVVPFRIWPLEVDQVPEALGGNECTSSHPKESFPVIYWKLHCCGGILSIYVWTMNTQIGVINKCETGKCFGQTSNRCDHMCIKTIQSHYIQHRRADCSPNVGPCTISLANFLQLVLARICKMLR